MHAGTSQGAQDQGRLGVPIVDANHQQRGHLFHLPALHAHQQVFHLDGIGLVFLQLQAQVQMSFRFAEVSAQACGSCGEDVHGNIPGPEEQTHPQAASCFLKPPFLDRDLCRAPLPQRIDIEPGPGACKRQEDHQDDKLPSMPPRRTPEKAHRSARFFDNQGQEHGVVRCREVEGRNRPSERGEKILRGCERKAVARLEKARRLSFPGLSTGYLSQPLNPSVPGSSFAFLSRG